MINDDIKYMTDKELAEYQSICGLVYLKEDKHIDVLELKKLIMDYASRSTMSYQECLILFRIDIFKNKSYQETFNKFLNNK